MKKQRGYDKLARDLCGGPRRRHNNQPAYGGRRRLRTTLAVWGNAQFASTGRGQQAVPTKSLKREMKRRIRFFVEIDEFRTSKIGCCNVLMARGPWPRPQPPTEAAAAAAAQDAAALAAMAPAQHQEEMRRRRRRRNHLMHNVVHCTNPRCPRPSWDRNVLAAINMVRLFWLDVYDMPLPLAFRRTTPKRWLPRLVPSPSYVRPVR